MENNDAGKANLMDLPNELLVKMFKCVDISSRFRMRLNRRLDQIQLSVSQEMVQINATIDAGRMQLVMCSKDANFPHNLSSVNNTFIKEYTDLNRLRFGLERLAQNTRTKEVRIQMRPKLTEAINHVINALFSFEISNELYIYVDTLNEFILPQLTFSRFLTLSKSIKKLECKAIGSLTVQDVCEIRKAILHRDCTIVDFYVKISASMQKKFLEEAFAIIVDEVFYPAHTRMFHCPDNSIELFYNTHREHFLHYEDSIKTMIGTNFISIKTNQPDELRPVNMYRVPLNTAIPIRY